MFHLGRRVLFEASNFLAFDQFELYQYKDGSEVTDDVQLSSPSTSTPITTTEKISTTEINAETTEDHHITTDSLEPRTNEEISTISDTSTTSTTTTTTITLTSSHETSSVDGSTIQEIGVYSCTFDTSTCGVTIKTNGSFPLYSTTPLSSQSVGTYKITDVTSISKTTNSKLSLIFTDERDN